MSILQARPVELVVRCRNLEQEERNGFPKNTDGRGYAMNRFVALLFIVLTCPILVVTQNTPEISSSTSTVADLPMLFRGPEPAVEVMVNVSICD